MTDSKSLVQAIQGGPPDSARVGRIKDSMSRLTDGGARGLEMLWVPGHCGLEGNERADRMAGEGAAGDQEGIPMDRSTRLAH